MDYEKALRLRDLFFIQALDDILVEKGLAKTNELRERAQKILAESKVLSEEDKNFFAEKHIL